MQFLWESRKIAIKLNKRCVKISSRLCPSPMARFRAHANNGERRHIVEYS